MAKNSKYFLFCISKNHLYFRKINEHIKFILFCHVWTNIFLSMHVDVRRKINFYWWNIIRFWFLWSNLSFFGLKIILFWFLWFCFIFWVEKHSISIFGVLKNKSQNLFPEFSLRVHISYKKHGPIYNLYSKNI